MPMQGAGTYMFRIDDERVIDATRAGSVAHLINHSCEVRIISPDLLLWFLKFHKLVDFAVSLNMWSGKIIHL